MKSQEIQLLDVANLCMALSESTYGCILLTYQLTQKLKLI